MGFNPKKELSKVKEAVEAQGYKKDVPCDVFCFELMLVLGTNNRSKANKWIVFFKDAKLIEIKDNQMKFL